MRTINVERLDAGKWALVLATADQSQARTTLRQLLKQGIPARMRFA